MVQVDLPAAFTIGHFLGYLSRKYLKKEKDKFKNKLLGPLNFYLTCGFVPGGLFLLIGWPAWEMMYTTPWVENTFDSPLKAVFYVGFVISMVLIGNAGYILAHHWYQKGKDKYVIYGLAGGFIVTILPFLLKWGVWLKVGTYSDIHSGGGYSFWEPPFFFGWLGIMSYLAITAIAAGIWFKKMGDKLSGN